ncbi:MAG: phosphate ABC transporter, permease protein PstA [Candidatus Altiarchaeales archaeon ex4484_96]|nr:MAG: phosphate ABC transporter, permease protein PstA [Candidatus Altiarchaeales archaeon ex4484_96]
MISSKTTNKIMKGVFWISASLIIIILFLILGYVFSEGITALDYSFITEMPKDNWREGGIYPAIIGTLILVAVALLFAVPLGVLTGVYLVEFRREDKLTQCIRVSVDSLNAVPSIVFGLFGLSLFFYYLRDLTGGPTILSGGLTLGFMILPTIIRTSEVALRSVPLSEKLGSYALGATKLQTISRIIIPSSIPGIITGVILGFGRAAGETAPIIFMVVLNPVLPGFPYLFSQCNALTTQIYYLTSEAVSIERAFGMAFVLISIILISNYFARLINKYMARNIKR